LLPSEALSARDAARLCDVPEAEARRLIISHARSGRDGLTVEGGPIRVRGTWLATLGWWRSQLQR
jgi:hypothetical protein